MKTLIAALAALLVAAPLAAQGQPGADAQAQQPTFRTGVDVITVDVGAVDTQQGVGVGAQQATDHLRLPADRL